MSRSILIYGGKGALGSICVKYFKDKNFNITSVDFADNEQVKSITLNSNDTFVEQYQHVIKYFKDYSFDAILNVAGGWCGGNAISKDFIQNCDISLKQSVWTSCISASLATNYLKEGGLLVLPGAKASLQANPNMIAYCMAKSCVNDLTKNLSQPQSGLPNHSTVLALLPITLDTPMNRKWMPKADFSTWTPLETIAEKLYEWIEHPETRPESGSLVEIQTSNNKTLFIPVLASSI